MCGVVFMADEDNWRNDYPDEERDSDASSDSLDGSDDEDICRYHSHRRHWPRGADFGKLVFPQQQPTPCAWQQQCTQHIETVLCQHVQMTVWACTEVVGLRLTTGKLRLTACLVCDACHYGSL